MIRTPIATTEDIDNATFFASRRLADLLRGEIGFDGWDADDADCADVDPDAYAFGLS
jgi:hypothetical protein